MKELALPTVDREVSLNSQEIAALCDKRHDNVLRDIRQMCRRLNIDLLKFEEIYHDTHEREQKRYRWDKRYALTLVSSYDIHHRDKIAKRITDMEKLTPNEFIFYQAANMVAMERTQEVHASQLANHEVKLNCHDDKIKEVKVKLAAFDSDTGFSTIMAYGRSLNYRWSSSTCQELGRRAAALCRKRHIQPGKVADERYRTVGSYPVEVLDEIVQASSDIVDSVSRGINLPLWSNT